MRVLASSMVLCFLWRSAAGMGIPVPEEYSPPEWFSAASGEEFVVAASEVTSLTATQRRARLFWATTSNGKFRGEPVQETFDYSDYSDNVSVWEDLEFSICHWTTGDQPRFSRSVQKLLYTGDVEDINEKVYLSSPGFTFHRSRLIFGTYYTITESILSDYDITPAGDFAAVERLYYHAEPFDWSGGEPVSVYSARLATSDGVDITYDDTHLLFPTAPRYNPATKVVHVLGIEDYPDPLLLSYHFSDVITTSLLMSGSGDLSDLDFRPDRDDRLHVIWREAGVGLQYAVCQNDVLSAPVVLADPEDFQFPFTLKTNDSGDLYLFNLSKDGRPTLWTRYPDSQTWEVRELAPIPEAIDRIDGVLNADGGVTFLAYRFSSPAKAWLWRADSRGYYLRPIDLAVPEDAEVISHSITGAGHVGLLIEKADAGFWIMTDFLPEWTAMRSPWWLY